MPRRGNGPFDLRRRIHLGVEPPDISIDLNGTSINLQSEHCPYVVSGPHCPWQATR